MGNCLALCDSALDKQGRYVRVAKSDGDVLEFSSPEEASHHKFYYLPPDLPNADAGSGIKRLKLVITKQQLEQLLAKHISLEDVLSHFQSRTLDLPANWRPRLDSIPEEMSNM